MLKVQNVTIGFIIGMLIILCLSSCCRQISSTRSESNSTRVDVRYVEKEILRTDTVLISLPTERVMDIQSSYSHLETSLATSTAWVDSASMLRHTLENRAVSAPMVVVHKDREIVRDSIVYRDKIVEVERIQEKAETFREKVLRWISIFVVAIIGFVLGYCFKWIRRK